MRHLCFGSLLVPWFAATAFAVTSTTVSFQNGVNGYTGTFDRKIDERVGTNEFDGSTVQNYFLDGYAPAPTNSPDAQGLIRFDNVIGAGAGQVPVGAFILDAQLQLTTSQVGSAQTNGPWGVSRLLQPFDSTTSYFANYPSSDPLGSRGAWWQDAYSARPTGGYPGQLAGSVDSAPIRPIVQAWSDGQTNNGVVVQSGFMGTSDGWSIQTTGNNNPAFRPKLGVTYTTAPIATHTFQHGVNNYQSDTMAWVRGGAITTATVANPDPTVDDSTYDGISGNFTLSPTSTLPGSATPPAQLTSFQQFLDGPDGATSPDDLALVKFTNLFGAAGDQAPANKSVAKAWLVITTGDTSSNARSPGAWGAFPMLRDWDSTSLYSSFGTTPGLQASDGDISPAVDVEDGMITGSEVWFDVTSYIESIRKGAADHGLAIMTTGTTDGWQIHFNGSDEALRPRLIIASDMTAIAGLAGDFNGDGIVDSADYTTWRDNFGSNFTLNGNGDESGGSAGVVDDGDFLIWKASFGHLGSGIGGAGLGGQATVPEPDSAVLCLISAMTLSTLKHAKSRKRKPSLITLAWMYGICRAGDRMIPGSRIS
jgi:hypothetical protein